jgi:hypothetical protein
LKQRRLLQQLGSVVGRAFERAGKRNEHPQRFEEAELFMVKATCLEDDGPLLTPHEWSILDGVPPYFWET